MGVERGWAGVVCNALSCNAIKEESVLSDVVAPSLSSAALLLLQLLIQGLAQVRFGSVFNGVVSGWLLRVYARMVRWRLRVQLGELQLPRLLLRVHLCRKRVVHVLLCLVALGFLFSLPPMQSSHKRRFESSCMRLCGEHHHHQHALLLFLTRRMYSLSNALSESLISRSFLAMAARDCASSFCVRSYASRYAASAASGGTNRPRAAWRRPGQNTGYGLPACVGVSDEGQG